MAKVLKMPRSRSLVPHVIQARKKVDQWFDVPGLLYGSKASAWAGLDRLLRHAPDLNLRVRPQHEPLKSGRKAA